MYWKRRYENLCFAFRWWATHWRFGLQLAWYRAEKQTFAFALFVCLIVAALALALQAVFAQRDEKRHRTLEFHAQNLTCLARNVYFEARGEPTAGQYAVAEVTMNRKASGRYPDTVCEVVYQQNWDPIRRRRVGAFSWTEFSTLEEPGGEAWQRAREVAEAVYYQRHTPAVEGALFFHAAYVNPNWAKERQRVARIGNHVFYK